MRTSEVRVLMRIFGSKREKVTGGWRKLHNEEIHNSYSSPNIIADQIEEDDVNGTHRNIGKMRVKFET
jgi:hypothetical protein